jgi:hypothetical protein
MANVTPLLVRLLRMQRLNCVFAEIDYDTVTETHRLAQADESITVLSNNTRSLETFARGDPTSDEQRDS